MLRKNTKQIIKNVLLKNLIIILILLLIVQLFNAAGFGLLNKTCFIKNVTASTSKWVNAAGNDDFDIVSKSKVSVGPSLAINNKTGFPSVAWCSVISTNYEICYAKWNGISWVNASNQPITASNVNVSKNSGDSKWPSLVLDPKTGNPCIAWCDWTNGDSQIYYSRWNGSNWVNADGKTLNSDNAFVSRNDGNPNNQQVKLRLDPVTNNPGLTWLLNQRKINFAKWNGQKWVNVSGETMTDSNSNIYTSSTSKECLGPTFVFNKSGEPIVAWNVGKYPVFHVYISKWNGKYWANIKGDKISSENCSINNNVNIALEDFEMDLINDKPSIIWWSLDDQKTYYARLENSNLVNASGEILDDANGLICDYFLTNSSLAILNDGLPSIASRGENNDIFYAKWDGTNWVNISGQILEKNYFDNDGNILCGDAFYPSLEINTLTNSPCVAWYQRAGDYPNMEFDVCYSRWDGGTDLPKPTFTFTPDTNDLGTLTEIKNLKLVLSQTNGSTTKFTVKTSNNLVKLSVVDGNIDANSKQEIEVNINPADFKPGNHEVTISVGILDNELKSIIKFTVLENIHFTLTPDTNNLGTLTEIKKLKLVLSQTNGSTIKFTVKTSNNLVKLSVVDGNIERNSKQEIDVTINPADFEPGGYQVRIYVVIVNKEIHSTITFIVPEPKPTFTFIPDTNDLGTLTEIKNLKLVLSQTNGSTTKFTVKTSNNLVKLSVVDGNIDANSKQEIEVNINPADFKPGNHEVTISVGILDNELKSIIKFTIPEKACIKISPEKLDFGFIPRGREVSIDFTITFNSSEEITGVLVADKPWLKVSPSNFKTKQSKVEGIVTISASELPGGDTFLGHLRIITNNKICNDLSVEAKVASQPEIVLEMDVGIKSAKIGSLNVSLDSPPIIKNSRTLVPVRFISEAFGCTVKWDAATKKITITRYFDTVTLWIGKSEAIVNGSYVKLDVGPMLEQSTTYIPIRFISDAFKAQIEWFSETKHIKITYKPPKEIIQMDLQ